MPRVGKRLLICMVILCLLSLNSMVMAQGNVVATIPVDTAFSIAVNPSNQRVYAGGDGHLYVIDSSDNTLDETLTISGRFFYMAVNSVTNRVYAIDTLNVPYHVVVVDGEDNSIITQIEISGSPNGIAVDPSRNLIYVTNGTSGELDIIDGSTNTISDNITIGSGPGPVAVNPITNRIFVAYNLNHVAVVNGSTKAVVKDIAVDDNPVRLAVNTFTNKVYVATNYNYVSTLNVIDGDGNMFLKSVAIAGNARNVSVNSITNRVYIAVTPPAGKSGSVVIVNGETDTVATTLTLGKLSFDIGVDSITSRLYAVTVVGSGTQPSSQVEPLASQGGDSVAVYQDVRPALVAPIRDYYRMRTPTLRWAAVDWAEGYRIQIAPDPNFASPILVPDEFSADTLSYTTNSLGDGIYYWHVRAKRANGTWGSWSATQTFEVDA